ncbi:hypothetical protein EBI_27598 [Enterocytozoon bieneusi H348]|nr:hypothetical protein EBI_27598 [Enterocytozoon bieneusi H348]|eukprot:XP_002650721.1 hypothetical protein EBI_27598 [Enterocytozoon bieneusi H348]
MCASGARRREAEGREWNPSGLDAARRGAWFTTAVPGRGAHQN